MNLRDAMRKAAALLVEAPADSGAQTPDNGAPNVDELLSVLDGGDANAPRRVDDLVRGMDGPDLQQIAAASDAAPGALPLKPNGEADFAAIYASMNVPPVAFGAEQMLEVLASLPPELPLQTRRQTVKVTLNALVKGAGGTGTVTPDALVADASRKMAALSACAGRWEREGETAQQQAAREIAELEAQIAAKRAQIEDNGKRAAQLKRACEAEAGRLDDVLEFFSLDLPPSKHAA